MLLQLRKKSQSTAMPPPKLNLHHGKYDLMLVRIFSFLASCRWEMHRM